jgi:hypothetical protein
MAVTNFTPLLGLALPTTGDLSGTWGTTVNTAITDLLDDAVAGTVTLSADADVTLTTTNGADNQARNAVILWTAGGTATRTITVPAQSKAYVVVNKTSSTQSIIVKGSGTTNPNNGATVIAGEKALVVWNGADFVKVGSTVSTVAVATANGFAGTNTNGTVTLTTTVTGVTKGNGSVLSAATAGTDYLAPPSGTALLKANSGGALANATAGTDYVAPGVATTFTAQQTFNGSSSVLAATLVNAAETVTVSATAATGTINYDVTTQSVVYYTSNASANWTMNFRASSGTSLDSAMSVGQSVTVVFLATNGSTAYYNNSVSVGGSSVSLKYQGGIAWSYGSASGIDAYTYTIIKTASATFTVLASQIRFA